jgi:hypothetical protein
MRLRAVTLAGLLFVAACGDSVSPAELAGTYALTAVDGRTLPRLTWATVNCDVWLTGGTLTLEAGGSFTLALEETTDCTRAGGQETNGTQLTTGSYALSGEALAFTTAPAGGEPGTFAGTVAGDDRVHLDLAPWFPTGVTSVRLALTRH